MLVCFTSRSIDEYFRVQALCMHNANVAIMGAECWLSSLRVRIELLPLSLLCAISYVFYHNGYRFARTRTLLYFFLNWARDDSYTTIVALLALFGASYALGVGVSAWLRQQAWGLPCFVVGLLAIMRLRPPPKQA